MKLVWVGECFLMLMLLFTSHADSMNITHISEAESASCHRYLKGGKGKGNKKEKIEKGSKTSSSNTSRSSSKGEGMQPEKGVDESERSHGKGSGSKGGDRSKGSRKEKGKGKGGKKGASVDEPKPGMGYTTNKPTQAPTLPPSNKPTNAPTLVPTPSPPPPCSLALEVTCLPPSSFDACDSLPRCDPSTESCLVDVTYVYDISNNGDSDAELTLLFTLINNEQFSDVQFPSGEILEPGEMLQVVDQVGYTIDLSDDTQHMVLATVRATTVGATELTCSANGSLTFRTPADP